LATRSGRKATCCSRSSAQVPAVLATMERRTDWGQGLTGMRRTAHGRSAGERAP
jgi:hypothetical protein